MTITQLDRCASGTGCQRDGYDRLEGMCEPHFRAAIDEAHADFVEAYRRWKALTETYEAALKARERGEDWR
jgi:hypothetical protein